MIASWSSSVAKNMKWNNISMTGFTTTAQEQMHGWIGAVVQTGREGWTTIPGLRLEFPPLMQLM